METVDLMAGAGVEIRGTRWVEGAWAGPFDDFDPAGAWLAGTAGDLEPQGLTLFPPFHSFDAVYLVRQDAQVWASNSLAFLLEAAQLRLRHDFPRHLLELAQVIDGLDGHHVSIPLEGGISLEVLNLLPVTVAMTGTISVGRLPQPPELSDYGAYVDFLTETCARILDNAASLARRLPMAGLATVSSGYDSAATAAIARRCGVSDAVTITHARDRDDRSTMDDSGAPVAAALGLDATSFERDARWSVEGDPVIAEFLATGMSGEEVPFRALAEHLRARVVLTGAYGDKVWGRSVGTDDRLRRSDLGGSSLTELRLRTGCVHLPVPMLGAVAHPSIAAITGDRSLAPWSVGGDYDRPIPRRIAEDSGVPRQVFGRTKRAVTVLRGRRRLHDDMVRRAVRAYRAAHQQPPRTLHRLSHAMVDRYLRFDGLVRRLTARGLGRPTVRSTCSPASLRQAATLHGPLGVWAFLWAVDLIGRERYRVASRQLPR